jgi:hypothetical protein
VLCLSFISVIDVILDVAGKLEGESIVGDAGVTPKFWYRMEPTQDNPESIGTTTDWIQLIRNLGDSSHTHIHISDKGFFDG